MNKRLRLINLIPLVKVARDDSLAVFRYSGGVPPSFVAPFTAEGQNVAL